MTYSIEDVGVLIPHYNNLAGLIRSLGSVKGVFVLVVDDGSNFQNEIVDAVESFGLNYKCLALTKNVGIEGALNAGILELHRMGKRLIARLDSGDVNLPSRLNLQIDEFNRDPDLVLVGGNAVCVDVNRNEVGELRMPCADAEIRKLIYLNSVFIHPSVMYRVDSVMKVGCYSYGYPAAEDYALFFKLISQGVVSNLGCNVIEYEISPNSISTSKRKQQISSRVKVIFDNFYFGIYPILGIFRGRIALMVSREKVLFIRRIFRK